MIPIISCLQVLCVCHSCCCNGMSVYVLIWLETPTTKLKWIDTQKTTSKTKTPTHQIRVPQKECGKRSSITFFRFRDAFGHFSVTFSDAFVTFSSLFCQTPFAGLPFAADPPFDSTSQRKTKGQQLKGQKRLGTLSHFLALFRRLSHFFRVSQYFYSRTFS